MAAAADPKRQKMGVTIGTHSGSFHADEALGCALLLQTQKFVGADVVRTRDPEVLKTLDVVVDVGGVYEPGGCAGSGLGPRRRTPAGTPCLCAPRARACVLLPQRRSGTTTTSAALRRCLATASTPSCRAQVRA